MKTFNLLLIASAIFGMLMLSCCEGKETSISDPLSDSLSYSQKTLDYLKSIDLYAIEEHSCAIDTSSDRYIYPINNNRVPSEFIDSLSKISTLGVIETVLFNPLWDAVTLGFDISFLLQTTDNKAVVFSFERTNPGLLQKLYDRDDAANILVNRYLGMYASCPDHNYYPRYFDSKSVISNAISLSFLSTQHLLAEEPILSKLSNSQLREVAIHVMQTYITANVNYEFGWPYYCISTSAARLAIEIMEISDYWALRDSYEQETYYTTYIKPSTYRSTGLSADGIAHIMSYFNEFIQEKL